MVSDLVLADDILEGADAIAEFLFGSKDDRRRVYYLSEASRLPVFRFGAVLCARKSTLMAYITSQENRALPRRATAPDAPDFNSTVDPRPTESQGSVTVAVGADNRRRAVRERRQQRSHGYRSSVPSASTRCRTHDPAAVRASIADRR